MIFPRGFSANFVILTWSLCGGILVHGLLANFRAMLLKPVLEEPVDTAQDILDRGMTVLTNDGMWGATWHVLFEKSLNPVYNQLAKKMYTPKDFPEKIYRLEFDVLEKGTHVYLSAVPLVNAERELGLYHYGKEYVEGTTPFIGWLINKMWPLNEALEKHILVFQQTGLLGGWRKDTMILSSVVAVDLQVVQLDHLILPFAILGSGIMAALFVFMIEMYFKK